VNALCEAQSSAKYGVEPLRILLVVSVTINHVLRGGFRAEKFPQISNVDRAKKHSIQHQPENETSRQEELAIVSKVIAIPFEKLQCDKRKDLRPQHRQAKPNVPQLERVTIMETAGVVGNDLEN